MKDDLISREVAIEAIKELLYEPDSVQYIWSSDALSAVKHAPSVPAVPLDKLCEWLAVNASYIFGGYKNTWKFEARHWEYVIREWMKGEGLDADN